MLWSFRTRFHLLHNLGHTEPLVPHVAQTVFCDVSSRLDFEDVREGISLVFKQVETLCRDLRLLSECADFSTL